jgi:hypothetical protein
MAYVLSLRPHSPLKRSFSDNPYLQSYSPLKEPVLGQLNDITARNASACSLYSLRSSRAGDWILGSENTPPLSSRSQLNSVPSSDGFPCSVNSIDQGPRKRACGPHRPPPSIMRGIAPSNPYSRKVEETQYVSSSSSESSEEVMEVDDNNTTESEIFDLYEAIRIPLPGGRVTDKTSCEVLQEHKMASPTVEIHPQPFKRWMSTLRRRHAQRQTGCVIEAPQLSFNNPPDTQHDNNELLRQPHHLQESLRRNSESMSSSMGCVTAMKSASITIASNSIAPRSETGFHSKGYIGNRGSTYSDARKSTDSHRGQLGPIIDESAWLRSLQRRKVIEELIASEESYIADLKVLINVCPIDLIMIFTDRKRTGLLHGSCHSPHVIQSYQIIHTAQHLPDPSTARGSASRTSSGGAAGRLH